MALWIVRDTEWARPSKPTTDGIDGLVVEADTAHGAAIEYMKWWTRKGDAEVFVYPILATKVSVTGSFTVTVRP